MSDTTRTFASTISRAERQLWSQWFRRHGVDPNDVITPGAVERRVQDYQLVYESVARNEQGRPVFDKERDSFAMVTRVFQLEGPPLPFPAGVS